MAVDYYYNQPVDVDRADSNIDAYADLEATNCLTNGTTGVINLFIETFGVLAMAPPKRLREAIDKAGERRKQQLAGIIAGLRIHR